MIGPYCPYDPAVPEGWDERINYIDSLNLVTDGRRSGVDEVRQYCHLHGLRNGALDYMQSRRQSIAEDVQEIAQDIESSTLSRVWLFICSWGRINSDNFSGLLRLFTKAEIESKQAELQADFAPAFAENLRQIREIEEWVSAGEGEVSESVKAIWNALGGRRETFPRFVVISAPVPAP